MKVFKQSLDLCEKEILEKLLPLDSNPTSSKGSLNVNNINKLNQSLIQN